MWILAQDETNDERKVSKFCAVSRNIWSFKFIKSAWKPVYVYPKWGHNYYLGKKAFPKYNPQKPKAPQGKRILNIVQCKVFWFCFLLLLWGRFGSRRGLTRWFFGASLLWFWKDNSEHSLELQHKWTILP